MIQCVFPSYVSEVLSPKHCHCLICVHYASICLSESTILLPFFCMQCGCPQKWLWAKIPCQSTWTIQDENRILMQAIQSQSRAVVFAVRCSVVSCEIVWFLSTRYHISVRIYRQRPKIYMPWCFPETFFNVLFFCLLMSIKPGSVAHCRSTAPLGTPAFALNLVVW